MSLVAQGAAAGGGTAEVVVFWVFGVLALGSAIAVITLRNIVHGALMLVLNLLSLAGLYLALETQFLSIIQVLVYAGGIMVLFLFVIMLVNLRDPSGSRVGWHGVLSGGVGLAVVALILSVYGRGRIPDPMAGESVLRQGGNLEAVGQAIFADYLLPFEVASVLLLVAMIAVIVLARPMPKG